MSPSNKQRKKSSAQAETVLGMPGSLRWPGWKAIGSSLWNKAPSASAFPPKAWGYGWSFNFAYPLITQKPWWARAVMAVFAVLLIVLLVWVLAIFATHVYYWIVPGDTLTLIIE